MGIPRHGWRQVAMRVWHENKRDRVPLLASAVAFWAFLSLFPALIAAVNLYGLVADAETVTRQANALSPALPEDAASLLAEQMRALTSEPPDTLGVGLVVSLLAAFWSASAAITHMIAAINIAYDEEEGRGIVHRKALALLLTVGAIGFVVLAVGLIAVAPLLLDTLAPQADTRTVLSVGRWVGLVLTVMLALAVLYRVAPNRASPRFEWVSVGSVVATGVWLLASWGFSVYVDNFSRYGRTYGALAGVAVLMLWLWITSLIVLLGAEINAEAEQQTIRDSTVGEPQTMGERGAVKADSRPDTQRTERKQG